MDNIVNDDYYNWIMSQDFIFSLLYSPSIIPNMDIESQIVQIDTKKLEWAPDKKHFSISGDRLGQILIYIQQKLMDMVGLLEKKN